MLKQVIHNTLPFAQLLRDTGVLSPAVASENTVVAGFVRKALHKHCDMVHTVRSSNTNAYHAEC